MKLAAGHLHPSPESPANRIITSPGFLALVGTVEVAMSLIYTTFAAQTTRLQGVRQAVAVPEAEPGAAVADPGPLRRARRPASARWRVRPDAVEHVELHMRSGRPALRGCLLNPTDHPRVVRSEDRPERAGRSASPRSRSDELEVVVVHVLFAREATSAGSL